MELVKRISEALRANSHTQRLSLEIVSSGDSVAINGTVRSYYQKQIVSWVATKAVGPGIQIFNEVHVALQNQHSEVTWESQGAVHAEDFVPPKTER